MRVVALAGQVVEQAELTRSAVTGLRDELRDEGQARHEAG
jgi:hypothetical protein